MFDELCIPSKRHLTGETVIKVTILAFCSTLCFGDNTVAYKKVIVHFWLLSIDRVYRGGICASACALLLVMFGKNCVIYIEASRDWARFWFLW